ncbi:MAG: Gfo/Idh/MocA family oxidoreductase [Planctomycetota bacterium]
MVLANHSATRRQFLHASALAAGGCAVVTPEILGGPNQTPPSDQFRFLQIGVGGRGRKDLAMTIQAGGTPVGLCDVDVQRAGKTYETHPSIPRYTDYRRMLEELADECDAVVISTPDHSHAAQAMAAMSAGKHVYIQKPLARTFDECERLREAAKQTGVATQMGNQGHAGLGLRVYREAIRSGQLGKIKEVHAWTDRPIWPQGMPAAPTPTQPPISLDWNLWLGPAAMRPFGKGYVPFAWRGWWDFGCGALGDMGCHNMDPAVDALRLELPTSVHAKVSQACDVTYPTCSRVNMVFPPNEACPDGVELTWYDGRRKPWLASIPANDKWGDPGFEPERNGCLIVGDRMSIAGGSHAKVPQVVAVEGDDADVLYQARHDFRVLIATVAATASDTDAMDHYARWIHAAKTGEHALAGSHVDYACGLTQIALLGCIATRFPDQELIFDRDARQFIGNDTASSHLSFKPRDGFSIDLA